MLTNKSKHRGFSLIELMISLVIGLIIIAAGITIFVNTATTDFYQLKVTRLNQELRSTMNLMSRDIRRVGYIGPNGLAGIIGTGDWNPFISPDNGANFLFVLEDVNNADSNAATSDCIVFALDQNSNGSDDGNNERFGYRFANNTVQMRPNNGADCEANGWEAITDDNTIRITSLTFTPRSQRTGNDDNLILCSIDISLTGQLISDTSVNRTVNQSVKLRNDIYDPTGAAALCQ